MEEVPATMTTTAQAAASYAGVTISAELAEEGLRMLQEGVLREECPPPTLFAVVQALGAGAHRAIIARQKAAADVILADPEWGPLIRSINHAEVKSNMRQQVPLVLAEALRERCAAPGYGTSLDEEVLPELLCAIAHKMRPRFEEALLAVAEAVAEAVTAERAAAAACPCAGRRACSVGLW